ncbi:GNAT family N-acetyltransferase [Bacillus infantis]|uniref:GNAT family N-acetyltransferase n=1 Tax=Bacillus infantis TaxID=324767 RepID=UPI003CED7D54
MAASKIFLDHETERLFLRKPIAGDTEFIYQLFSDERICEFLYDEEPFTCLAEAEEFVESYSNPEERLYNRWMLVKKEDGRPIGTCGFHCWDRTNHIAEIGYDLWHEYWGQGYMNEALKGAIGHGFSRMGLNRINAYVAIENKASSRLLEKLGFVNEGTYRDKHLFRGKYYDHYSYSLLKKDWDLHAGR